ncbi:MAG: hypothetical protein H7240_02435 [Glaciimonas sp.]|nr:hypothetical protein [Glaciimonas sp.]
MTTSRTPELIGWYFFAGGSQISYPVAGLWPVRYLEYAKADFDEEKSPRCWVNTVSNAKKVLHYQVDALATALGWEHMKSRNNFPSKLNFLGSCGVLSPTIINRMNRLRNSVEHDYYEPTEDQALEYLEIVELYLGATHYTATYFPSDVEAELMSDAEDYDPSWDYPKMIQISLPEGTGKLTVHTKNEVIIEAAVGDTAYFEWVSVIVRQNAS